MAERESSDSVWIITDEQGVPCEVWSSQEGAEASIARSGEFIQGAHQATQWHVHDVPEQTQEES